MSFRVDERSYKRKKANSPQYFELTLRTFNRTLSKNIPHTYTFGTKRDGIPVTIIGQGVHGIIYTTNDESKVIKVFNAPLGSKMVQDSKKCLFEIYQYFNHLIPFTTLLPLLPSQQFENDIWVDNVCIDDDNNTMTIGEFCKQTKSGYFQRRVEGTVSSDRYEYISQRIINNVFNKNILNGRAIIFCDVKLENIMMDKREAVLTDLDGSLIIDIENGLPISVDPNATDRVLYDRKIDFSPYSCHPFLLAYYLAVSGTGSKSKVEVSGTEKMQEIFKKALVQECNAMFESQSLLQLRIKDSQRFQTQKRRVICAMYEGFTGIKCTLTSDDNNMSAYINVITSYILRVIQAPGGITALLCQCDKHSLGASILLREKNDNGIGYEIVKSAAHDVAKKFKSPKAGGHKINFQKQRTRAVFAKGSCRCIKIGDTIRIIPKCKK